MFNRPFRDVAHEYLLTQEARAKRGEISAARPKKLRAVIEGTLDRYAGSTQVHLIGDERWGGYPAWRRENGAGRNRRNGVRDVTADTVSYTHLGPILEQGLNGGGGACFFARASPMRLAGLRRLAQGRLPFLRRTHSTRSLPRTRSGQVVRFCFCTSETKFGELVRGFAAEVGRGETQVLRLRLFACANNLRSG